MAYTDRELLGLYEEWSEDQYCAGFINPSPKLVREFRAWLHGGDTSPIDLKAYEEQFLTEYHRQQDGDARVHGKPETYEKEEQP